MLMDMSCLPLPLPALNCPHILFSLDLFSERKKILFWIQDKFNFLVIVSYILFPYSEYFHIVNMYLATYL